MCERMCVYVLRCVCVCVLESVCVFGGVRGCSGCVRGAPP